MSSSLLADRANQRLALLLLFTALVLVGCQRPTPEAVRPRAVHKEAELAQVTVSAEAEERLGIPGGLRPLQQQRQHPQRLLAGEILPLPGRAVRVVAISAGTVQLPVGGTLPIPGARVRAGQTLFLLTPLLGPTERMQVSTARVDADGQVARAQVQDDAAEVARKRAEQLVGDRLAGRKLLDEAVAQRETARAALRAAISQRDALLGTAGRAGLLSAVSVESPIDGVLREVRVALREQVPIGTTLFEVVGDESLWVRTQVPSGELPSLAPHTAALIEELVPHAPPLPAPPVEPAPPTAQPQQGTVDRYFLVTGSRRFQLGQRVAVWLPLLGEEAGPITAASAILHDPSGATWLYERTAPQVFARRRVEVIRTEGEHAVLSPRSLRQGGLRIGSPIVTAGAMELYGTEFGADK